MQDFYVAIGELYLLENNSKKQHDGISDFGDVVSYHLCTIYFDYLVIVTKRKHAEIFLIFVILYFTNASDSNSVSCQIIILSSRLIFNYSSVTFFMLMNSSLKIRSFYCKIFPLQIFKVEFLLFTER